MSLVIILYLAVLSVFTLGYFFKGVSSLKNGISETGKKRVVISLKAQNSDKIDFDKFRIYSGKMFIFTGFLYLLLLGITFIFVPNLRGTLENREIHLIRTCIIAIIVLHLFKKLNLLK